MKKTIVVGVSSGIAAYKVVDLVSLLRKKGFEVHVVMTTAATQMIDPSEFIKASRQKVYTTLYPPEFNYQEVLKKREVEHIKLADNSDLIVVAPATANIIAKIAHGVADDFLTTIILAISADKVLICPSMNVNMWYNSFVQENLGRLSKQGFHILHPDAGALACGYTGIGRLADIGKIEKEINHLLKIKDQLKGKKIIVTAGGTSEPIDAVRVITNRSSGKMGSAIAQECYIRGADVLLLKSQSAVETNKLKDTSGVARRDSPDGGGIRIKTFETGKELSDLIKKHIKSYDIMFHVAAVSDFTAVILRSDSDSRIDSGQARMTTDKKLDSRESMSLRLRPAPKILHQIKTWNPRIKLIGFKAVYKEKEKDLIKIGLDKLKESNSDFIIVNDVGREGIGFSVDDNEVYIISSKGLVVKIDKAPKIEVARKILDSIFPTRIFPTRGV